MVGRLEMHLHVQGSRAGRRGIALLVSASVVLGLASVGVGASADERFGRRREMLSLTNQDRSQRDRAEVGFAARLSRYARRHSAAMARRGEIFHSSPDQIRAALDGYDWSLAGENVGVGPSLDSLEDAFMDSKLHRQNILRTTFRHAAIGVVRDDGGHLWVTVIFYG
jgi:uncharacterized protein YkwD